MSVPNLDRATTDEVPDTPHQQEAPVQANGQLVGCYLCLLNGNVENPSVIYHYAGTSYCMEHLYQTITQSGGNE